MISKYILFVVLFLIGKSLFCQLKLSGYVVDQETQLPVEYANIGIAERGIGTVCDQQGKFTLTIPAGEENSELVVSRLGYNNTYLALKQITNYTNIKVSMDASVKELNEFIFSGKDKIELGFRPQDDAVKGFFKVGGLGMEGGTVISNPDTVELINFNMNILELPYDEMKFRINIYEMQKSKPGNKLNRNEIYFSLKKDQLGIFRLNFEEKIIVKGNFLCTLELLEVKGDVGSDAKFAFSAIHDKKGLIFNKGISMGNWNKIKKFSLCFWLEAMK